MKLTLFFKNMKQTPALDSRIVEKSEYLSRFFDGSFEVQWYCYAKPGLHKADVCVIGPQYRYRASASSENLYKCLDLVLMKMTKQLHKSKEKKRDKIHKSAVKKNQLIYLFKDEKSIRKNKEDKAS